MKYIETHIIAGMALYKSEDIADYLTLNIGDNTTLLEYLRSLRDPFGTIEEYKGMSWLTTRQVRLLARYEDYDQLSLTRVLQQSKRFYINLDRTYQFFLKNMGRTLHKVRIVPAKWIGEWMMLDEVLEKLISMNRIIEVRPEAYRLK